MKSWLQLALLALPLLLNGCLTPFIEGATEAYDHSRRDPLRSEAIAGDPAAQFRLGNSYCCRGGGPLDLISIYDNQKATRWYCRAARQGYGPAQLQLARIYAGHPIRGLRIAQHVSAAIGDPDVDIAVALMWADVAAKNGIEDAVELRADVAAQASDRQLARAAALGNHWRTAPCLWTDVISGEKRPHQRIGPPARSAATAQASG